MENSWEKSLLVIFVLLSRVLHNFFLLMTNSVDQDSDNDKSTVHDYLAIKCICCLFNIWNFGVRQQSF